MDRPQRTRDQTIIVVWSVLLAALLLGPALGRGFVLSYDMVWVPDLSLRPDALGMGSALPRAVPSDAVIGVLDEVLPGWLLQKVVLLAALVGGGLGMARLLAGASLVARLVAVSAFQWSPFLVERLVLGHWPVLLGYAALPWLVIVAGQWRERGRLPWVIGPLVVAASLSASTGLVTGVALFAAVAERGAHGRRRLLAAAVLLAAANAPWLVSGLLHAGSGTSDPAGAALFALAGEGSLPAPLTALTLGGVWNAEVVPSSREGLMAWISLAVVLLLAVLGARPLIAHLGRRTAATLGAMWAVGFLGALWTWAWPDSVAVLAEHVPGGGVLRDGSRLLALCAPGLVAVVALGAARVCALPGLDGARLLVGGALVALPVLLMPDAVRGVGGSLQAVQYPDSYAEARRVIADDAPPGDVVLLPFTSYRQPSWNHHHKVLDPSGRYQPRTFVASDRLLVDGVRLHGEDPRAVEVAEALAAPDAAARARALRGLGIGVLLVDRDAPGEVPAVAGTRLLDAAELEVIALPGASTPSTPTGWRWAMGGAWLAFAAAASGVRPRVRRRRRN